jgi:hypothetical protein
LACNVACSFPTFAGGTRLTPLSRWSPLLPLALELRSLPSPGVTRLRRYYGPLRLPRRPGLALAGVRLGHAPTAWGLPCCVASPCADIPSPRPRWDRRWDRVAPLKNLRRRPSPRSCRVGSHIKCFRGLLSVHSRYGLPARGTAWRSFASKASAISLPPSPLRLLPAGATVAGWELHPLKMDTFARRTAASSFPVFSGLFRLYYLGPSIPGSARE